MEYSLKPPGHPNHHGSYFGPGEAISVSYAAKSGHNEAKNLMDSYVPPPITDPLVQEWIKDCKRHWHGCWVGNHGEVLCQWSKGRPQRPLEALDFATHFIRGYYPNYLIPAQEGEQNAE